MKKKPSALAKRICRRWFYETVSTPLWQIVDEEVARATKIKFKTDANGKKVVVKNGQVIGRQG